MSITKKDSKPEALSEEQFEKLVMQVEEFNEQFFIALAGTDKYEIVPTLSDQGQPLTKEQYSLLKNECSRLGLKILYQIQNTDGTIMYINSENGKIGYMHDGMH